MDRFRSSQVELKKQQPEALRAAAFARDLQHGAIGSWVDATNSVFIRRHRLVADVELERNVDDVSSVVASLRVSGQPIADVTANPAISA